MQRGKDCELHKLSLLSFAVLTTTTFAQLKPRDPLVTELRAKDEILLNAVHRGNRDAWKALTTPDFLYIEDGLIALRDQCLE